MKIQKSAEDYLEAMLMVQQTRGYIRSIDVATKLGVTKPSVSYAVKRLRENGYITMEVDGIISLTEQGMTIAQCMYERHQKLTELFTLLGVDEATAEEDACKVEHDISQQTFEALMRCHRLLFANQLAGGTELCRELVP